MSEKRIARDNCRGKSFLGPVKILACAAIAIGALALTGVGAKAADKPTIDASQASKGIISVSVKDDLKKTSYVVIISDAAGNKDTYFMLEPTEQYPVSADGKYKVMVGPIAGKTFKPLATDDIDVKVAAADTTARYLISSTNTRWNTNMKVIKDYGTLLKDVKETLDIVKAMYKEMTVKYTYDYDKMETINKGGLAGYKPDIDNIYGLKKGICYDYSAVFASELRSKGIPCRLVMGYAPETEGTYHAWNEVYVGGKWFSVDTTVDSAFVQAGQGDKVKMEKDATKRQVLKTY